MNDDDGDDHSGIILEFWNFKREHFFQPSLDAVVPLYDIFVARSQLWSVAINRIPTDKDGQWMNQIALYLQSLICDRSLQQKRCSNVSWLDERKPSRDSEADSLLWMPLHQCGLCIVSTCFAL